MARVACSCGKVGTIPDGFVGTQVRCKACKQLFVAFPVASPAIASTAQVEAAWQELVQEAAPSLPEPEYFPPTPPIIQVSPTSRLTYILLAIFLGKLGIQDFVIGRNGVGIAKLLLCIFSVFMLCAAGVGIFGLLGLFVWNIIDIINVTTDAQGRRLQG